MRKVIEQGSCWREGKEYKWREIVIYSGEGFDIIQYEIKEEGGEWRKDGEALIVAKTKNEKLAVYKTTEDEIKLLREDPEQLEYLLYNKYVNELGEVWGSYIFARDFELPYTLESSEGWIVRAYIPLPNGKTLIIQEWGMESPYDDPRYARYEWIE